MRRIKTGLGPIITLGGGTGKGHENNHDDGMHVGRRRTDGGAQPSTCSASEVELLYQID